MHHNSSFVLIHVGKRLNISACREFPRLLGEFQSSLKVASLFPAEMFNKEMYYHRMCDTHCTWLAEANVPVHVIEALA